MDKKELKELLKELLAISIDDEKVGGEHRITVRVSFDGETISSDYFNLYD